MRLQSTNLSGVFSTMLNIVQQALYGHRRLPIKTSSAHNFGSFIAAGHRASEPHPASSCRAARACHAGHYANTFTAARTCHTVHTHTHTHTPTYWPTQNSADRNATCWSDFIAADQSEQSDYPLACLLAAATLTTVRESCERHKRTMSFPTRI